MEDALQVELVTPEKLVFSGKAEMVEAPGVEGDFGVLANHAPLVSLLREGTVAIHLSKTDVQYFEVTGGTAEVNEGGIVILAESVTLKNAA